MCDEEFTLSCKLRSYSAIRLTTASAHQVGHSYPEKRQWQLTKIQCDQTARLVAQHFGRLKQLKLDQ